MNHLKGEGSQMHRRSPNASPLARAVGVASPFLDEAIRMGVHGLVVEETGPLPSWWMAGNLRIYPHIPTLASMSTRESSKPR
jgi:hypothetical protein